MKQYSILIALLIYSHLTAGIPTPNPFPNPIASVENPNPSQPPPGSTGQYGTVPPSQGSGDEDMTEEQEEDDANSKDEPFCSSPVGRAAKKEALRQANILKNGLFNTLKHLANAIPREWTSVRIAIHRSVL